LSQLLTTTCVNASSHQASIKKLNQIVMPTESLKGYIPQIDAWSCVHTRIPGSSSSEQMACPYYSRCHPCIFLNTTISKIVVARSILQLAHCLRNKQNPFLFDTRAPTSTRLRKLELISWVPISLQVKQSSAGQAELKDRQVFGFKPEQILLGPGKKKAILIKMLKTFLAKRCIHTDFFTS
jgi:hypothetical protein